jgi:hypothetical protein
MGLIETEGVDYPVSEQVKFAGTHHTPIFPACRIVGILLLILVPNLVLKGQLQGGRIVANPPAQSPPLHIVQPGPRF